LFDGGHSNLGVYVGNAPVHNVDPRGSPAPWFAMEIACVPRTMLRGYLAPESSRFIAVAAM
jgi:hypothetical protein